MAKKNKGKAKDRAKVKRSEREQKIKNEVERLKNLEFKTDERTLRDNDRQIMFYNRSRRTYGKNKSK